ncbi:Clavaminate synthase-like protein [Xylaria bambusicola]|uniref:Clavaminate synthase-like protein n=1 Tax=Xylaria bambusicola TaxID=326684 RepID=UPI002007F0F6|nr:Clavaminate synthase-like protein [Xylaria bambusicola]KAI0502952.1 Clavaminate synthase-like protein [Xylaria bambusicola]
MRFASRNIYASLRSGVQSQRLSFSHRQLSQLSRQPLRPSVVSGANRKEIISAAGLVIRKHLSTKNWIKPYGHHYGWNTDITDPTSPIHFVKDQPSELLVTDRAWLRDACTCSRCVDPSSGQKHFASTDVSINPEISKVDVTKAGNLLVHWKDDFLTHGTHVSVYPASLWLNHVQPPAQKVSPIPWDRRSMEKLSPSISFKAFMEDSDEHRQAMIALILYGLIFLRDVPTNEDTVKAIAARIGGLQDTLWGPTWSVRSKPNAENIAYTNGYLGPHQDLLYLQNCPRIQILHCLKNSCSGGESLFCDGYHVEQEFRERNPQMAKVLRERLVTYHYDKGRHLEQYSRPVLSGRKLWWSPHFQKPVQPDALTEPGRQQWLQWHEAARQLKTTMEAGNNVYKYKMAPGDCAIFDNHRPLHGREAFDTTSGERWFQGAYVDNASYESLLNSLGLYEASD